MAWLSPAYPTGAFSYSSGIEWAVEVGDINDRESLTRWLDVVLNEGGGFCDAVFFVHAYGAIYSGDKAALTDIGDLALAFLPSKERYLESTAQARAFIDVSQAAWPCDGLDSLQGPIALPVAVASVCAGHHIPVAPSLLAYLHATTASQISAGVRLVPLGQTDGQRALAALEPVVSDLVKRALTATLEDIGSAAFRADLASMRHETQYTRLFRS